MDKKTTQFDQRLSEYRDRLLQRNKEMTTDDDDRIDAIINGSADTEEMEAPAGMNEIQEQSEASEKEDTQREPEPVSESYKEYADKLESVLQEVGVSKKPEKKEENKKEEKKIEKKAEKKNDIEAAAERERKRLARKNAGLDKEETLELTEEPEPINPILI